MNQNFQRSKVFWMIKTSKEFLIEFFTFDHVFDKVIKDFNEVIIWLSEFWSFSLLTFWSL